jgi:hypothetical protein
MPETVTLDQRADARHDSPDDQMMQARAVARRYGISARRLDRWLRNHNAFPPPDMQTYDSLGRVANRFWRLRTVIAWESTRVKTR